MGEPGRRPSRRDRRGRGAPPQGVNAHATARVVERQPGDQGVGEQGQVAGLLGLKEGFPGPVPETFRGRQRDQPDPEQRPALSRVPVRVDETGGAFLQGELSIQRVLQLVPDGADHDPEQLRIVSEQQWIGKRGRQPAGEPVAVRIEPASDHRHRPDRPAEPAVPLGQGGPAAVATAFHAGEVADHVRRCPARVTGELGDGVPVGVVRPDDDQGVVGGAAADRTAARVKHAVAILLELRIPDRLIVVLVVPHEEVPRGLRRLGRVRVEGRHAIGQIFLGVATGFDHDHRVPRRGEPGGDWAASCAGSDHDVVGRERLVAHPGCRRTRQLSTTARTVLNAEIATTDVAPRGGSSFRR